MHTGWIVAMEALPDDLQQMVATQNPPASWAGIDGTDWATVFHTWAQVALDDPLPIGVLNGFLTWAVPNWGINSAGHPSVEPRLDGVRAVAATYFEGQPVTHELKAAVDALAADDGADDEDGTDHAAALGAGVLAAYQRLYNQFLNDLATQGHQVANVGQLLESTLENVRAHNRTVLAELPDRTTTPVVVYDWGGHTVVVFGDTYRDNNLLQSPQAFAGDIAKRRSTVGPGEWVVDDPGGYRDWIAYELQLTGSKKELVIGDPGGKYDEWDDEGTFTAAIRMENQRVVDNIPDRHYTSVTVWGTAQTVTLGDYHEQSAKLKQLRWHGYLAKRSARIGAGEWVVSDPGAFKGKIEETMAELGSKKDVVVGDPTKYEFWAG
jgi:hypothetical protein